jgi:uncharacterized protein (DUF1778 family)
MRVEKHRKRYRTVAFRMSEDEWQELDKRVALSGRQKQDFLIKSILHQKIVVIGNQVQFEKLKTTLDEILAELRRIDCAEDVGSELLVPIRTAVEIINGFSSDGSSDDGEAGAN